MVFENTSLILECDAEGYPVPWVAWIWKDKVLQNCTDGPKYLIRRHVSTEEAGNYTCMAGNSAGNTKYTFQVTVKGKHLLVDVSKMYLKRLRHEDFVDFCSKLF